LRPRLLRYPNSRIVPERSAEAAGTMAGAAGALLPRPRASLPPIAGGTAGSRRLRFLIFSGRRMATGTVKWFNEAKGYGFITPDDGGQDLFAHFSEIQVKGFKTLQEKQKVSFEVKTGPKGKQAAQIKPV
jgi:cold shock CspA family protein